MDEIGVFLLGVLVVLLLVGVVIAFPIHVLSRIAELRAAVQELRRELARRPRFDQLAGHAERPEPVSAPPTRPPAPVTSIEAAPGPRTPTETAAAEPVPAVPPMTEVPASALSAPRGLADRARDWMREAERPGPGAPGPAALPPATPPPAIAPPTAGPGPDLESVLGANWLPKLGVAALAIAAAFFLKYAFDSGWMGPTAQVTIGLVAAGILLVLGQLLLGRERYRAYAQVLSSGGIVIYFLSVYAAFEFYRLIGFAPAFFTLAVGALAASALAVGSGTQAVALLCLAGAFLTPALLHREGTGAGDMLRFYAYLAGLNVWSAALARVRPWPSVTALSFFATWLLFFGSEPGRIADYKTAEAFAAIYLVFACYGGVAKVRRDEHAPGDREPLATEAQMRIGLIVLGCLAFAIASVVLLAGAEALGLPALASVGVLLALLLAGIAFALQGSAELDSAPVSALRYLSAVALVLLVTLTIPDAPAVASEQAPVTFGFALFSYLLFLLVAWQMRRRSEGDGPAALLFGANALAHCVVSFHALGQVFLWGIPAAVLWLPLAGWIALIAHWMSGGARRDGEAFSPVALIAAQAMPAIAFLAAFGMWRQSWPADKAAGLIFGEFLLVSATWIAVRRATRLPSFRGDMMAAFGNAASFFALLSVTARLEAYQGFVLLCGGAIALAVYHAVVGTIALQRREDDLLLRYVYLGLALTFVTIAIPIQLKATYLTLAWSAESVVLVWTGMAVREKRLRWYGLVLLAVTVVKALCFDLPETPAPFHLLINPRMLSGASVIAAAYISAWLLRKGREELSGEEAYLPPAFAVAANLLTLLFVSLDLWDYVGNSYPAVGRIYAQQLTLSIFWSVYSLAAMSVGIWWRQKTVRLFALGLLYLSMGKVFLFDLSFLQQLYRIISLSGLGVILLLVSLIYLRFEERLK